MQQAFLQKRGNKYITVPVNGHPFSKINISINILSSNSSQLLLFPNFVKIKTMVQEKEILTIIFGLNSEDLPSDWNSIRADKAVDI